MINYTVKLDLTDNGVLNTGWRIKQGDYREVAIIVKIANNGETYFPDEAPSIVFRRPDGKSIIGQMSKSVNQTYSYMLIGNELAIAGQIVMDVKFDDRLSSASCIFECVPDTIGEGSSEADIYPGITMEQAKEAASTAAVEVAEEWIQTVDAYDIAYNDTTVGDALDTGGGGGGGGTPYWSQVQLKPFKTISNDDFKVEDDELKLKNGGGGGASTWADLDNKPFENVSTDDFNVNNGTLEIVDKPTNVTVTQSLTTGTKIGEIAVDGVNTELFAPEGGGGGDSDWSELTGKPFEDISTDDFSVDDDGVLHSKGGSGGASSWDDLTDKPFESLNSDNFEVDENGVLSVVGGGGGSGKIQVETELLATESTTDVITKTVKSLSNFDFVMLCAINVSGHIYQNQIIPIDLFRTLNTEINSMGLDIYLAKRYTSLAYYISDTSIGMRGMNPSDSGLTTRFYGIKLLGGSGSAEAEVETFTATVASGFNITANKVEKIGKIIVCTFGGAKASGNLSNNTWNTIGTVPTEVRPSEERFGSCGAFTISNASLSGTVRIEPNGNISVCPWGASAVNRFIGQITYTID